MQATTALPIARLYEFKPQAFDAKKLDALHAFYRQRATLQIERSLATRGRAVGANGYDHRAACALLEDLVSTDLGAVNWLVDLRAAFATGAGDAEIARIARGMMAAAVQLNADQTADALIEDMSAHKRFLPSPGVA
jgi:hypothetical protein